MTFPTKTRIAVFASGSGTNAENLIKFFRNNDVAEVSLVLSNNTEAYVLKRAENLGVPAMVIPKSIRTSRDKMLAILGEHRIDFIVLAGYLLLIPAWLVKEYPGRIVNIHPSLLPRYGGKGMYGDHVHNAVINSGDKESGITIHMVNEHYDQGDIIFQTTCPVLPEDGPDLLAARIHQLEYKFFPVVIENIIQNMRDQANDH